MNDHPSQLEQDRQQLQEILNRDEFISYRGEQESLWEQLRQFVTEWLLRLFPEPAADSMWMEILPYVLVVVSIGLLAWLMYWLAKQVIRRRFMSQQVVLDEEEMGLTATDYLHKARQVRDRHDWVNGVRYAFLALLMYWESQGVLTVKAWKTNGEYARELQQRRRELVPLFRHASLLFDRVWYGQETLSDEDYERFLQRVEEEMKAGEANGQVE